jgi:hypothetical protein
VLEATKNLLNAFLSPFSYRLLFPEVVASVPHAALAALHLLLYLLGYLRHLLLLKKNFLGLFL